MVTSILEQIINEVAIKLGYKANLRVIKSNRPELCDYQCDDAFRLAKEYRKAPFMIGNEIVEKLNKIDNFSNYFKEVNFVNPGFINLTISDELIKKALLIMNTKEKFGLKKPSQVETYVLDYGGPNVAKPLHVGHMRTAIVGESIKRIIDYAGHKTIADVHFGDYGLQIGQVIYGILEDKKDIDSITIEYLEETYPKISGLCKTDEDVKEKCALITKELQEGNKEYQKLWKLILEISGNDIKRLYKYLDVSFDLWQGESDAYKYISDTKNIIDKKDLIKESDGALIIEVTNENDNPPLPPLLWQKSNGAYLYGTTDLATIYERELRFKPDHILYIVDNRQRLHFNQVFRASKLAGLTDASLEFLGYGTINGEDGRPYKTRDGDAPKLDNLFEQTKQIFVSKKEDNKNMNDKDLDKIVNAILKFADLQNIRDRDYIFDINKFSNTVGKTGPYILYTYLRLKKVIENEEIKNQFSSNIYNVVDRNLRLKLLEFDKAVENAFTLKMPSYIAEYLFSLSDLANAFYQNNHINGLKDEQMKSDWVYILTLTNKVLLEMLKLIIIEVPSVM